jgi:glycosyltransferase involved in cell wall biosynthesis
MRILFAISVFTPSKIYGGPATVALNQAKALVRRGHEVTVVTSDILTLDPILHIAENEANLEGVRVLYFPTWVMLPRFSALVSFRLWKWLRRSIKEYDVVHVHFARDWIPMIVAREAVRQKVRVFLQPHGMLGRIDGVRKYLDRGLIAHALRQATGILCLQQTEEQNITSISPDAHTWIVPNGVAMRATDKAWSVDALGNKTVLFLGRLHPHKRVMFFIEAARMLLEAGHQLRFRIAGPDEGDLSRAQNYVINNGIEKAVHFIGPLDHAQVVHEYTNASVYVLPSINEAFPMAILEAMVIGLPVIVTNGIHIRGLLESRQAAMVVSPTPQDIAAGIVALFANPDLATRYSENGRRLVRNELTIDKVVTQLEDIYQGVC